MREGEGLGDPGTTTPTAADPAAARSASIAGEVAVEVEHGFLREAFAFALSGVDLFSIATALSAEFLGGLLMIAIEDATWIELVLVLSITLVSFERRLRL